MESYKKGKASRVVPASRKNPNDETNLNSAPEGPHAHCMGYNNDGGYDGNVEVKKRGTTFYFK